MLYDLPETKDAIEEWKLQSGFDSDCSLTVMKAATMFRQCINKFWWYDLTEIKDAIEEWKLQSGLYSDCSLTVMKAANMFLLIYK